MSNKIAYRYRTVLFALIMSASTAMIVSGIIIYTHTKSHAHFIAQWLGAFTTAWPIVFIAILIIAPMVNRLLNLIVENQP
ncbi:MAG: DUF2798 domain-containing protein [Pseudomonadota bacterium]